MSRSFEIEQMLRAVIADYRGTAACTGILAPSQAVLRALETVPRERFVPAELRGQAFRNLALPIAQGQTISQPYIVALMSDLLAIEPGTRVLEIGTGSGYQAAVLAALGAVVYSVELDAVLALDAEARLGRLGVEGVFLRHADGALGWPEHAPFDRVISTAAAARIPPTWFDQLGPDGRLVAPVGGDPNAQVLVLWTRAADGRIVERPILPVRFVPLRRAGTDRS